MEETYKVIDAVPIRKRVLIKRASDGLVARCKLGWLVLKVAGSDVYKARSPTKDLALGNLNWEKES